MGWRRPEKPGRFDMLPLVLQANGEDPEWFEIPKELILEVPFSHPEYVSGYTDPIMIAILSFTSRSETRESYFNNLNLP